MHVVEYRRAGCDKWGVKVYPSAVEANELCRLLRKSGYEVVRHTTHDITGLKGRRVA